MLQTQGKEGPPQGDGWDHSQDAGLEGGPSQWSSWESQNEFHHFLLPCRVCKCLTKEEKNETDEFLEECIIDPSLRERLSILSRTFENQRNLVQADSMLFLNKVFMTEPLVSTYIHSDHAVNISGSAGLILMWVLTLGWIEDVLRASKDPVWRASSSWGDSEWRLMVWMRIGCVYSHAFYAPITVKCFACVTRFILFVYMLYQL